jgi:hypothetical protein
MWMIVNADDAFMAMFLDIYILTHGHQKKKLHQCCRVNVARNPSLTSPNNLSRASNLEALISIAMSSSTLNAVLKLIGVSLKLAFAPSVRWILHVQSVARANEEECHERPLGHPSARFL